MGMLKELLKPLAEDGAALTREQAAAVLEEILAGAAPDVETAALLAVLATRGEQAPELAGFVQVMRNRALTLPLTPEERSELVDVVGTGGGGPLTFNISSGAALVAAAAGARVAKHGNRAITSRCGAADVLEALGVPISLEPDLAVECLRETGFMFLLAPLYNPAMKAVGPLRRALGFRTIFNLCGPLTNPAGARAQVIGVLAPSRVLLLGRTLKALGAKRAFVVHGTDGIDELTTTGESVVARIEESETGETTLKAARVTPEMAGLPRATLDQFVGGDVQTNSALLYDVLTGIPRAWPTILSKASRKAPKPSTPARQPLRWPSCARLARSTPTQSSRIESQRIASPHQFQRQQVGLALKVLLQRSSKDGIVLGSMGKQCHRRAELQVFGHAENLLYRAVLHLVYQPGTLHQTWTQHWVAKVGCGLVQRTDAVVGCLRGVAQAFHLRKNKPDPLTVPVAVTQLGNCLRIHTILRPHKAVEKERVLHCGCLQRISIV